MGFTCCYTCLLTFLDQFCSPLGKTIPELNTNDAGTSLNMFGFKHFNIVHLHWLFLLVEEGYHHLGGILYIHVVPLFWLTSICSTFKKDALRFWHQLSMRLMFSTFSPGIASTLHKTNSAKNQVAVLRCLYT